MPDDCALVGTSIGCAHTPACEGSDLDPAGGSSLCTAEGSRLKGSDDHAENEGEAGDGDDLVEEEENV